MFDRPAAIAGRLKAPLALAGLVFVLWFGLQASVFRSGAYWRVAEPDSNAGAVTHSLLLLEAAYRPGHRTVLVVGDSRVGEGFSGPLAARGGDIDFINLSVPGSTPRTWLYLLREIDRRGFHYDAVLIGLLYEPTDRIPTADWPLDPVHQVALIGFADLFDYPRVPGPGAPRRAAWRALLLPALTAQADLRALLAAPLQRWHNLRQRRQYIDDTIAYPGHEERLPAGGGGPPPEPVPAAVAAANARYQHAMVTRIAKRAAGNGAATLAFALPRGPYAAELPTLPGIPDWPGVRVLEPGLLADLEAPEYFFDRLHLNRAGRELLSARLGARVREELAGPAR
jgi:hypothetical protein